MILGNFRISISLASVKILRGLKLYFGKVKVSASPWRAKARLGRARPKKSFIFDVFIFEGVGMRPSLRKNEGFKSSKRGFLRILDSHFYGGKSFLWDQIFSEAREMTCLRKNEAFSGVKRGIWGFKGLIFTGTRPRSYPQFWRERGGVERFEVLASKNFGKMRNFCEVFARAKTALLRNFSRFFLRAIFINFYFFFYFSSFFNFHF